SGWFPHTPATTPDLPTYHFNHQHYWLDSRPVNGDPSRLGLAGTADHPLLGALVTPAEGDVLLLSGLVSLSTHPWLADHAVAGTTLLPGTAFLECALQSCIAADCDEVSELTLEQPLVLPAQGAVQLQVVVQGPGADGRRALAVHSRPHEPEGEHERPWTCHATGAIGPAATDQPTVSVEWLPADAVPLDLDDAYASLEAEGYSYGPAFQGLRAAWTSGPDLFAEVDTADAQRIDATRFGLHPALLDAALHVLAIDGSRDGHTWVPFSFSGVRLYAPGSTTLRARLRRSDDTVTAVLTNPTGEVVAELSSLRLRSFTPRAAATGRPLHAVRWTPWETEIPGAEADPILVRVPATEADCVRHVHQETTRVLAAVQEHLAEDRAVVVLTVSGDLAGAAVGGLVRSVQAERPGRVVLV
ncbi:polyketide synthase dehydratase domain-containing protein, partial [Streptomyces sulfonofaciens]|uniref:polyketide synthase dehydratase domain-containing protein n=1 Tax=Streptomyces sulfonofaciens TaxID=68272 RepID=UPI001673AA61